MKERRTYSGIIFAGMMLLLLAAIIWEPVFAQEPILEPDWAVFEEPGFGYRLYYPDDWHVSLVVDNGAQADRLAESVAVRSVGFFGRGSQIVFVDVWVNRSGLSLADWLERVPSPLTADPALTRESRPAAVAGLAAVRTTALSPENVGRAAQHYRTQFAHDDLIYSIEYAALNPDLTVYDKIVNSFRFVEPTQARLSASTISTASPPAEFGVQLATCCGITDPEYNPFPCNTSGDAQCALPPCGNCTWWARYRRTGGNDANLIHCTGDAISWQGCANQYYPYLLDSFPEDNAVTLYPGQNHLAFVEQSFVTSFYGSQLAWDESCPASYFNQSINNKLFIQHPDYYVPNMPPNVPQADEPVDGAWSKSREVTLSWKDGGDPDDKPQPERQYFATIKSDDWTKNSGWRNQTEWTVEVPEDGAYQWRVKSTDGQFESAWTDYRDLGVDSVSPGVLINPGSTAIGVWYNSDRALTIATGDASPSSGSTLGIWRAWRSCMPRTRGLWRRRGRRLSAERRLGRCWPS
jgi:hypothetical protein